jgi:Uncharacterised nucleotidyltransferase
VIPVISKSTGGQPRDAQAEAAWNFLLAASSAQQRGNGFDKIKDLLAGPLDWEEVLRFADHHGTSSLVYQTCLRLQDEVPPAMMVALRENYEVTVHRSLFFARELILILDCLESFGLEAMPYKGVVLSEAYYGDMAARQSGDIDLFVREDDVERITSAVGDLGYTSRVPIPEAAWNRYLATAYECTFDSPAGTNLLELQWALQPRFYAVDYDMDGLFQRAEKAMVAERQVKTPSAEDLLLVLSVHAAKHVWGRLIWLCDIAQILRHYDLDWGWIQSYAREIGIERILHITVLLTNRLLEEPIPSALEGAVTADNEARAFADQIAIAVRRGTSYEDQQVSYFYLMMQVRERRIDRMRFLTRLTFTPGPGEWETVRLPKVLFPAYRIVRLARLAARFARR